MHSNSSPIITINESGITLQTGLSSRQFANAKMGQYVTEPGIFVKVTDINSFTTEEFRFSDTKTLPQGKSDEVVLSNDAISGTTLLSLIEGDSQKALQNLEKLSSIIEWSFENDIQLPNCGPLGTIITKNGILFLPFNLFERSMFAQNKEVTSQLYGCWVNTALNDIDNWRFTLSCYLYTILSGQKPFTELDIEKRSEDYYDNNFIPINLLVRISESFSQAINQNLSLTGKAHTSIKPQKTSSKAHTITSQLREANIKRAACSLELPSHISSIEAQKADESLLQAKNDYIEKKKKALQKKRFFRKHKTTLAVVGIITLFAGFTIGGIIQSNLSKPTTEGMSPIDVVQTFYSSINTLDSVMLDSMGKAEATKNYSNMVASIFVTGKMREAYEQIVSFLPPAQWIGIDNPTEISVFGLTNLEIVMHNTWTENPVQGDTVQCTATFYTIINQGLESYEVTKTTDALTLMYGKNFWQITSIENNSSQIPVDSKQFIEDVTITRILIKEDASIGLHEQGVFLSETLRETYPWLPTMQEVKESVELIPTYLLES